jgi:hypothetical protein
MIKALRIVRGRWLEGGGGLFGSLQSATAWKIAPLCLLCCLWREKNDKSFEDCERTVVELKSLFFTTLYLWTIVCLS